MTSHYGPHDFNLGELRSFRVHTFATIAQANGEAASAAARLIYVAENQQLYFGRPGSWVPLYTATTGPEGYPVGSYPNSAALPTPYAPIGATVTGVSGNDITLSVPLSGVAPGDQLAIADTDLAGVYPIVAVSGSTVTVQSGLITGTDVGGAATVTDLTIPPAGSLAVVGSPAVLWVFDTGAWVDLLVADERLILADGSRPFVDFPGLADALTDAPTDGQLVPARRLEARIRGVLSGPHAIVSIADDVIVFNSEDTIGASTPDWRLVIAGSLTVADGTHEITSVSSVGGVVTVVLAVGTGANVVAPPGVVELQDTTLALLSAQAGGDEIAAHDNSPAAHAGLFASLTATVNGQLAVLQAEIPASIEAHETSAHADLVSNTALAGAVAAHNSDPEAHSVSAAMGPVSATDFGAPVRDGVLNTSDPTGLALRPSSSFTRYASIPVVFTTTSITLPVGGAVTEGDWIRFPGSILNSQALRVTAVVDSTVYVAQPIVAESVSSALEVINDLGFVSTTPFEVPNGATVLPSAGVTGIQGSSLELDGTFPLELVRPGDVVTVAGTSTGNNGAYTVAGINPGTRLVDVAPTVQTLVAAGAVTAITTATNEITFDILVDLSEVQSGDVLTLSGATGGNNGRYAVEAVDGQVVTVAPALPGTDAAAGAATIEGGRSAFPGTELPFGSPVDGTVSVARPTVVSDFAAVGYYYADATAPRGYSQTVGPVRLGRLRDDRYFEVCIERLGAGVDELTDGTTINTDGLDGDTFEVILAGTPRTLAAPTNLIPGKTYHWIIIQDVVGGRTLTFDAAFKFPGGVAPTLSAAAGAIDLIRGVARADGSVLAQFAGNFS